MHSAFARVLTILGKPIALLALSVPLFAGFDALPLRFEQNRGQADAATKFIARGSGYALSLTATGSTLRLGGSVIQTRIAGGARNAHLEPLEPLSTRTNYLSAGPGRSLLDVPSFARIRYRDAFPNVDLVFYGGERKLEYDLLLRPGADTVSIEFQVDGPERIAVDANGDLSMRTASGEVRWKKPLAYQTIAGKRREVAARFKLKGRRVGFAVGRYDHARTLVIDPVLGYVSYLGGRSNDAARAIAVDAAGNVYIAGSTESDNLPFTAGSFQPAIH